MESCSDPAALQDQNIDTSKFGMGEAKTSSQMAIEAAMHADPMRRHAGSISVRS